MQSATSFENNCRRRTESWFLTVFRRRSSHTETFLRTTAEGKAKDLESALAETDAPVRVEIRRVTMLACPAADESDAAALLMLQPSLDPSQWMIERTAVETLTSELVARIEIDPPAIVYIAALPPRGLSHARYLCKRLHEGSPDLQIVVGRWGQTRNSKLEREQLEEAGASFVTTSLVEIIQLLNSRLPLLARTAIVTPVPLAVPQISALVSAGH